MFYISVQNPDDFPNLIYWKLLVQWYISHTVFKKKLKCYLSESMLLWLYFTNSMWSDGLMCGDVILLSIVLYFSFAILCITMHFFLCLSYSFVSLSFFLVTTFDGLRPLLVASHCSLRSLANKLCSFVRSFVRSLMKISSAEDQFTRDRPRSQGSLWKNAISCNAEK